jgi:hypothetical protein
MPRPGWAETGALENPCFDSTTKTSCPRRCEGCHSNCPEWKAYEVKRDEMYAKRKVKYEARAIIEDTTNRIITKNLKKKQSLRRIKR